MGGVGVIRGISLLARGFDAGPSLPVVLRQTVCCALRRCGLQIVKVAILLLIVGETLSHVVEHLNGELLRLFTGHIGSQPVGVQSHLVHANQADGGKMVVKASQITLCIGIQALVQKPGDHFPLDLQGTGCDIHHMVKALVKFLFICGQIRDSRHVDGHHAHASGTLAGTEISAGFLSQLS